MAIESMAAIRRRHTGYWFSPDTMRFFSSRVGGAGYISAGGLRVYFVSSERRWHAGPRLYSVRVQDRATGEIDTPDGYQMRYASRSGADRAARRLAAAE